MRQDYFIVGCFAVEGQRRFAGPEEAFAYVRAEADSGYGLPDCPPVYGVNKKDAFVYMATSPTFRTGYVLASLHIIDQEKEIADPFGPAGCIVIKGWQGSSKGFVFGYVFYGFVPNPAQERLGKEAYYNMLSRPLFESEEE
jgi:hypothetical protein